MSVMRRFVWLPLLLALVGCAGGPAALGLTGPGTTITPPAETSANPGGAASGSTAIGAEPSQTEDNPGARYWRYN